jgi:hypothetical protein
MLVQNLYALSNIANLKRQFGNLDIIVFRLPYHLVPSAPRLSRGDRRETPEFDILHLGGQERFESKTRLYL